MDFDLGQVRAFLAVADLHHFGRAASRLNLTQQALSKRIQRLEQLLGEPLLVRGRAVELTEAGARFLPHARALLVAADTAVAETRSVVRPVRVDVWANRHAPVHWMGRLSVAEPRLTIEVSMRRSVAAAVDALGRGEVDVAFGRVPGPVPAGLDRRLVSLTPMGVLVDERHPLAEATAVRPGDLAGGGLRHPAAAGAPELTGYYQQFAGHFHVPLVVTGSNIGIEHAVDYLRGAPESAILAPVDLPIAAGTGARIVPLTGPVPRWAWSMLWRQDDPNPAVALLRHRLLALSAAEQWARYDPVRDWLPEPDAAALTLR